MIAFRYPTTAPYTEEVELPNPVLGDSYQLNTQTEYKQDMNGNTHSHLRNNTVTLLLNFTVLTVAERDNLQSFYEAVIGNEVRYEDHEGKSWRGYFVMDNLLITTDRDGCSYSTTIQFSLNSDGMEIHSEDITQDLTLNQQVDIEGSYSKDITQELPLTQEASGGRFIEKAETQDLTFSQEVDSEHLLENSLKIIAHPSSVQRTSSYYYRIEAQDDSGSIITSDNGALTFTVNDAHASDAISSVNLVNGVYEGLLQLTGGSGKYTSASVTVSKSNYNNATTNIMTIGSAIVPTKSFISVNGNELTFALARSEANAESVAYSYRSPNMEKGFSSNELNRVGYKFTNLNEVNNLFIRASVQQIGITNSYGIQLRYAYSEPSTGSDMLGGSLYTTITLTSGMSSYQDWFDISSLISGNELYIWSIATADYNNSGYISESAVASVQAIPNAATQ